MPIELAPVELNETRDQPLALPAELWAYYTYMPQWNDGKPFYVTWNWRLDESRRACGLMLFTSEDECARVCSFSGEPMGSGPVAVTLEAMVQEARIAIPRYSYHGDPLVRAVCLCDGMPEARKMEGLTREQIRAMIPPERWKPRWWRTIDN